MDPLNIGQIDLAIMSCRVNLFNSLRKRVENTKHKYDYLQFANNTTRPVSSIKNIYKKNYKKNKQKSITLHTTNLLFSPPQISIEEIDLAQKFNLSSKSST